MPGQEVPLLRSRPPGPNSRTFLLRHAEVAAPMGPMPNPEHSPARAAAEAGTIVYARGEGVNVIDVDENRYVDLAGTFGGLLLGHRHPAVVRALTLQAERLFSALGDVHPSDAKIALTERLARLYPGGAAQVILAQSGSDAVSAALKTAVLATGRPGVLAFGGAYHGLGYGPLAACGLRASYREPFAAQLGGHVRFIDYPGDPVAEERALDAVRRELAQGTVGAVLVEPILGRGGVVVPPPGFLPELARATREAGALLVADEIWTGLGRAGALLRSASVLPDLVCLGKGLGGGLPVSAVLGKKDVMASWRRPAEVVHTSTFAGAPLADATALATLDVLSRERLPERAAVVGARFVERLERALAHHPSGTTVRGAGLMVGLDLGGKAGAGARLMRALLARGYITTTGGGRREVLVLTPPLIIAEELLEGFVQALGPALEEALS